MDKKHGIIGASMAAAAGSFWCCCVANVAGQLKPGFAVAKKEEGNPFIAQQKVSGAKLISGKNIALDVEINSFVFRRFINSFTRWPDT